MSDYETVLGIKESRQGKPQRRHSLGNTEAHHSYNVACKTFWDPLVN